MQYASLLHLTLAPQLSTDTKQQVVWEADYAPFGEVVLKVEKLTQNIRFPGQYYDVESGLHYNWHRYYDPALGRYLQPDPIGLVGYPVHRILL